MKVSVINEQRADALRRWPIVKLFTVATFALLALVTALPVAAQNTVKVQGHVADANGQAVPRPSITVKNTKNGVTGDENGDFTINAPSNATLIISSINFTTLEVKVNGHSSLSITLVSSDKSLGEVVVVGYGTQRKRDVTGAVTSVSAATLAETPGANVVNELKGRAAGVDIVSNGATPGSSGSIRIRGNRSMTTSQSQSDLLDGPLIVVDGIPFSGSLNDISPDDIQSLEILKDASATAIYGSRGSGGVILVTTRRGRVGKSQVSFSSYYGVSSVMGEIHVMNGPEFAQFKLDAATYNRSSPGASGYTLTSLEAANLAAGVSTDWQKVIYKNGFTSDNQLNFSGGDANTQYGLGLGYYTESNEIPSQKYQRFSLRLTLDHQISKSLKIGVSGLTTYNVSNLPGGAGVPGTLLKLSPLATPYNADGSLNVYPQPGIDAATYVNPLTLKTAAKQILARNRRIRSFNSLYGEWSLPWITGLKYRMNIGLDYTQAQADSYNPISTYVNNANVQSNSNASVSNSQAYRITIEHLLLYNRTFGKHSIGFTGLFSTQKDHAQASQFTVLGVPADYIQDLNLGLASGVINAPSTGNLFNEQGLISYMARVNYGYDNRYLLTATVRRDGSSVLSPGHQWYTYPAFSAGWNIMNEKFAGGWNKIFSNLKIRGGWGITSNQGVAPYSTLGLLSALAYNFGQGTAGQQAAYTVSTLANQNLHWESTAQTNVGLDFGILKDRITGSFEVYQQHTKDILLQEQLPISNGATSYQANVGKTSGHGIELSLSTVNVKTPSGFTWSTDINLYLNREKIVFITAPSETQNTGNGWFVGQPLTVIYDFKKIGIWQTSDSGHALSAQTSPTQYPGEIRVQDLNGDGKIDANDRQVIGNFQPKWEGGLTSRMTFKNIDFSFVMFARMGMKVLVPYISSDGGNNGATFFNQGRINQVKVDYWTRSNPTNNFPAPDASLAAPQFGSTLQYEDGSFIKMRSINLGYTFTNKLLGKTGITSLRVYASVENPFIIYSPFVKDGYGPDPEGNGYGGAVNGTSQTEATSSTNRQISVNANNPSMRTYNFGLNLKF